MLIYASDLNPGKKRPVPSHYALGPLTGRQMSLTLEAPEACPTGPFPPSGRLAPRPLPRSFPSEFPDGLSCRAGGRR